MRESLPPHDILKPMIYKASYASPLGTIFFLSFES